MIQMTDLDLNGKRVLIREDFNVPMDNGRIADDQRIKAAIPTIQAALSQGAKQVILMSHLGRPTEGAFNAEFSLAPVAKALVDALNKPVELVSQIPDVSKHNEAILLLENVRFFTGEKKNDAALAKQLGAIADVFVMDAFATAHRAQASTVGVAQYAPVACAGPLLMAELNALTKAMQSPQHPFVAIVGGSKVSTKLTMLNALVDKVDQLIVGGGIANTFLAAAGYAVGQSLYEKELIPQAKELFDKIAIPLPTDVVVAKTFSSTAEAITKQIQDVADDDMILDIGPDTAHNYANTILQAKTIVWNGPVGVFEWPAFADGTRVVTEAIASSDAYSLAGGGDTLAAIAQFGVNDKISYISTGGGAFLQFIEGEPLPAVSVLTRQSKLKATSC